MEAALALDRLRDWVEEIDILGNKCGEVADELFRIAGGRK